MSRNAKNKDGIIISFHKMLYPRDRVEVELASQNEIMSMDIDMNGDYRTTSTCIRNVLQREEASNEYNILVSSYFLEDDEAIVNYGSQIAH